jgi:hypothetical protein
MILLGFLPIFFIFIVNVCFTGSPLAAAAHNLPEGA